jgi:hypothetical protein
MYGRNQNPKWLRMGLIVASLRATRSSKTPDRYTSSPRITVTLPIGGRRRNADAVRAAQSPGSRTRRPPHPSVGRRRRSRNRRCSRPRHFLRSHRRHGRTHRRTSRRHPLRRYPLGGREAPGRRAQSRPPIHRKDCKIEKCSSIRTNSWRPIGASKVCRDVDVGPGTRRHCRAKNSREGRTTRYRHR